MGYILNRAHQGVRKEAMARKGKDGLDDEKNDRKQVALVAKHLRFNVHCKTAIIKGQKVEYFSGNNAVDCLMNSKWAECPRKEDESVPHFASRADAVSYCNRLLKMEFFVRANKVEVKPVEAEDEGQQYERKDKSKCEQDSGKKKRKFRLEIHKQQLFRDSSDVYFWKYDPPSKGTYMIGFIVVLGAIAWTLQPLWPESTRVSLWYLAVGAGLLIGVLIALIIMRWFLFGIILVSTAGRVYFWIFPNLNDEKRGFVDSFKPIYSMERKNNTETDTQ